MGENARLKEQVMKESESCEDRSQLWWFLFNLLHPGSSGRWISVVSSLVYMGKSRPANYIVRLSQRPPHLNRWICGLLAVLVSD